VNTHLGTGMNTLAYKYLAFLALVTINLVFFLSFIIVHLHYGENGVKLVGFREQKKIFCFKKPASLAPNFSIV